MTEFDTHLHDWLRDAHAMEMQALTMMKAQVSRLDNYPELCRRIEQHIDETQAQAERLESCMKRQDTQPSVTKDIAGRFTASMQGLGGMMASDEVLKGQMSSYAFEHFEIAAYNILIVAADAAGDAQTRRLCEEILREEEAMAKWLLDHLGDTTHTFMTRDREDVVAKR